MKRIKEEKDEEMKRIKEEKEKEKKEKDEEIKKKDEEIKRIEEEIKKKDEKKKIFINYDIKEALNHRLLCAVNWVVFFIYEDFNAI
jgi:Fe2+ transport system protein B